MTTGEPDIVGVCKVLRGMDNNRDVPRGGIGLQFIQDLESGPARHHQIQDDEFGTLKAGAFRGFQRIRLDDPVLRSPKHLPANVA